MKSFLEDVAQELYGKYGSNIATLKIVFPSRRASLFFGRALSQLIDKPIWQPTYLSIDEMVHTRSTLQATDHLRLLAELYMVYNEHHPDSFDKFYNWGELLLRDFDTIDKYLIDAHKLYANISDIKDIDDIFKVEDEDAKLILDFWKGFYHSKADFAHQQSFLKMWHSLSAIYDTFKNQLATKGIGYNGMIYRDMVENIPAEVEQAVAAEYCFVGFNALNECEKRLFVHLKKSGQALFFWDADRYYVDNVQQESGLFIRQNIALLGDEQIGVIDSFKDPKNITVFNSPSDIMQCQALYQELEKLATVDHHTAVVLTDERLLPLVLQTIPPNIDKLNITMGYPLNSTIPYVILERLIELQKRRNEHGNYYYQDVLGLLSHPYLGEHKIEEIAPIQKQIIDRQSIHIEPQEFANQPLLAAIFCEKTLDNYTAFGNYLVRTLAHFAPPTIEHHHQRERREFLSLIVDTIERLNLTVQGCGIEISLSIYLSLLRSTLAKQRIPYTGEPLEGLQIMGILETRNLDFENVFVLSMCDENFPAAHSSTSYIPQTLRQGFHLPTPEEHLAVYSYYFYRLIQRADNVTLMYSSSTEGNRTGEPSRYISQLMYESPHTIVKKNIELRINTLPVKKTISIPKNELLIADLRTRNFSPSAINTYIHCSLRFYYQYVASLATTEDKFAEDITPSDSGNILHQTLERLYRTLPTQQEIQTIANDKTLIETTLDQTITEILASKPHLSSTASMREMVLNYILRILNYDARLSPPFRIEKIEKQQTVTLQSNIKIKGKVDRVDRLQNNQIRIVDYKSGNDSLDFDSLEALFTDQSANGKYKSHNSAALQALIYAYAFDDHSTPCTPALYLAKRMAGKDFSPCLVDKTSGAIVTMTPEITATLKQLLTALFDNMMDIQTPFTQTTFAEPCQWCPYRAICDR